MLWNVDTTNTAYKQLKWYERKDKPKYKLFQKAIRELEVSDNPTSLGKFENLTFVRAWSYRVTGSLRLLYVVDEESNTILILAAGTHTEVYRRKF